MSQSFIPEPALLQSPRGRHMAGWDRDALRLPDGPVDGDYDVVIVGAGPAGLAVVGALWHQGVRDVLVLDATGRVCGTFLERVNALQQAVLRSPYEHHPGAEGHRDCELLDFARLNWAQLTKVERNEVRMAQSGQRSVVPVDVFETFVMHVARNHDLPVRGVRATVRNVRPAATGFVVHTDRGAARGRFVVLALGETTTPPPRRWELPELRPESVRQWDETDRVKGSAAVVGSGLSAAHLITRELGRGVPVTWVQRRQERYQCADVNASFFRPEGRAQFMQAGPDDRLTLLRAHRQPSIMFEFRPLLQQAEQDGRLQVLRRAEIQTIEATDAAAQIRLAGGQTVVAEQVWLALGTTPVQATRLLADVRATEGHPDVDSSTMELRSHGGVFVAGAQGALAVGPASRNLDGHRVAASRIADAVVGRLAPPVGAAAVPA